eukprot:1141608-Pelagomonas_calceolata.AAC.2
MHTVSLTTSLIRTTHACAHACTHTACACSQLARYHMHSNQRASDQSFAVALAPTCSLAAVRVTPEPTPT